MTHGATGDVEHGRCCGACGQPLGYRSIDKLTGLLDRWGWDEHAGRALAEAGHRGSVLLVLDLDWFRNVNNEHGHLAGDAVLRAIGSILTDTVRDSDVVSRFGGHGGDEFLVLLAGADPMLGMTLARRIRDRVQSAVVSTIASTGDPVVISGLTVSVGLAIREPGERLELSDFVRQADGALLRAKRAGRDRIMLASVMG
jgi:diguanylate cyclase (GGDEF)-like protein